MRLRVGLIGTGKHGLRYAHHIRDDFDELELVAISRRDRTRGEQSALSLGCEYVADPREIAEREDIDLVIIAAAPVAIHEIAVAAAEAGKRLLIEKPVAIDLPTGLRLLEVFDRLGTYCMAAHTLRLNATVLEMARRVNELGRLDTLIFSQRFPPQLELAWLDDPTQSGGGNILHTGVHCFDLCSFLTGMAPVTAFCVARNVYTQRTEDVFQSAITLSDGSLASINCSRTTQSRNGLIEISGEHGQLVGDHVLNTLYRIGRGGREEIPLSPPRHTVLELLRLVIDDWRNDRKPTIDYRAGVSAIAVADACYRSMRSGRAEPVVLSTSRP